MTNGGPASVAIPDGLLRFAGWGEGWARWLEALPSLAAELLDEWDLRLDGDSMHGFCALVLPVRGEDDVPAVLKISWPHDEEQHEYLMLQALEGNGMPVLFRCDPERHALLMERLDATHDLGSVGVDEACVIAAGLYARLHIPALPELRPLSAYIDRWTTDLESRRTVWPIPPELVDRAQSLGRSFIADNATNAVMMHGDLHYQNVLAADREPWLVIDPKPMAGDAHYEVAALLWNRFDDAVATGDPKVALERRFRTIVEVAGLDEPRARDWVLVREVHNAMWSAETHRPLDEEDRESFEHHLFIAEAIGLA